MQVIQPRSGLRLFVIYAALTLVPIMLLGTVLARSFKADLDRNGLSEGSAIASTIARGTVEPALAGDTLADGPTLSERIALERAFRSLLLRGDALQMRLRDTEGHVVFDPEHPDRGPYGPPDEEVVEAIAGEPVRLLTRLNADEVDASRRLGARAIEVYMPIRASQATEALGALEIYVPYEPIGASISTSYRHARSILVVGLLALWSLLAVVTWSVTRRLRRSAAVSERMARTDALTGLANRTAMVETLRDRLAQPRRKPVSVAVIDIDGFGAINETLGQENGDAFLAHVATVIRESVGQDDLVARVGGDQFGIAFLAADGSATDPVIDRVRRALLEEHNLGGLAITVEVTIGRVEADAGMDASELIRRANVACRAAKQARVPMLDYGPEHEGFDADRLNLIADLRHGIAEQQLVLHYQPKVDIADERVVGVEALVRWQHPTRGLLMPDTFVPAAESTELIIELTDWVVERRVPPGGRMVCGGAVDADRGQCLGTLSPRFGVRGSGARRRPAASDPGRAARDRDHRDRGDLRSRSRRGHPAQTRGPWHQDRDRRLRRRLHVPRTPRQSAAARAQDRPPVHRPADGERGRRHGRALGGVARTRSRDDGRRRRRRGRRNVCGTRRDRLRHRPGIRNRATGPGRAVRGLARRAGPDRARGSPAAISASA